VVAVHPTGALGDVIAATLLGSATTVASRGIAFDFNQGPGSRPDVFYVRARSGKAEPSATEKL